MDGMVIHEVDNGRLLSSIILWITWYSTGYVT